MKQDKTEIKRCKTKLNAHGKSTSARITQSFWLTVTSACCHSKFSVFPSILKIVRASKKNSTTFHNFYFLPSGQVHLEAMYRTLLKLVFRLCLTPWPPLILAEWLKIYMQFVCYKYSPQQCIFMLWIQEEHGFFAFPLDCVSGRNAVDFKFTEEIKFESSVHF